MSFEMNFQSKIRRLSAKIIGAIFISLVLTQLVGAEEVSFDATSFQLKLDENRETLSQTDYCNLKWQTLWMYSKAGDPVALEWLLGSGIIPPQKFDHHNNLVEKNRFHQKNILVYLLESGKITKYKRDEIIKGYLYARNNTGNNDIIGHLGGGDGEYSLFNKHGKSFEEYAHCLLKKGHSNSCLPILLRDNAVLKFEDYIKFVTDNEAVAGSKPLCLR
jgi:hypothetical protein